MFDSLVTRKSKCNTADRDATGAISPAYVRQGVAFTLSRRGFICLRLATRRRFAAHACAGPLPTAEKESATAEGPDDVLSSCR